MESGFYGKISARHNHSDGNPAFTGKSDTYKSHGYFRLLSMLLQIALIWCKVMEKNRVNAQLKFGKDGKDMMMSMKDLVPKLNVKLRRCVSMRFTMDRSHGFPRIES